jgi:photoactive yellow protein
VNRAGLADLAALSTTELDVLPIGAIVVDIDGTIRSYNECEAGFSHLDAARVIGKSFFSQVAPCTAGSAFEGRMQTFAAGGEAVSASFNYFFPFAHGDLDVTVTFVRLPDPKSILIAVERREDAGVPVVF